MDNVNLKAVLQRKPHFYTFSHVYIFHCLCHTNIVCDSKTDEHVKFINQQCPISDNQLSNDSFQHYLHTIQFVHQLRHSVDIIKLLTSIQNIYFVNATTHVLFHMLTFSIVSVLQTYCAITKIWMSYTCNVQSVTMNYRMISSNTIFTPSSFSTNRDTLLTGQ